MTPKQPAKSQVDFSGWQRWPFRTDSHFELFWGFHDSVILSLQRTGSEISLFLDWATIETEHPLNATQQGQTIAPVVLRFLGVREELRAPQQFRAGNVIVSEDQHLREHPELREIEIIMDAIEITDGTFDLWGYAASGYEPQVNWRIIAAGFECCWKNFKHPAWWEVFKAVHREKE